MHEIKKNVFFKTKLKLFLVIADRKLDITALSFPGDLLKLFLRPKQIMFSVK